MAPPTRIGARLLPALIALAIAAHALAADPRDEARARLRAGVAFMEQGEYAGALAEFEAAYALVPNPKLQFNIGTAYDALARHAAAHQAFTSFLADPRDAPAETVSKARAKLAALEKKVARIAITSDQADDQVFVDGRPRGATPLAKSIVVDAGAHAVTIKRGEAQYAENVALGEGEEKQVSARFAPPVASQPDPAPLRLAPQPRRTDGDGVAGDLKLAHEPQPAPAPAPFYRRTWFWLVIGGGLAAAGLAGAFALRGTEYPAADAHVTMPMTP